MPHLTPFVSHAQGIRTDKSMTEHLCARSGASLRLAVVSPTFQVGASESTTSLPKRQAPRRAEASQRLAGTKQAESSRHFPLTNAPSFHFFLACCRRNPDLRAYASCEFRSQPCMLRTVLTFWLWLVISSQGGHEMTSSAES